MKIRCQCADINNEGPFPAYINRIYNRANKFIIH